jgi:hypothetical protein
MIHRRCLSIVVCAILLLFGGWSSSAANAGGGNDKRTDDASLFSSTEYINHIRYLASNELEGRGTGQAGNDKAAEYIADVFRKHGVEPAGNDGSYFQNFTLRLKNRIGEATQLAVGSEGRKGLRRLRLHEDFVPLPFSSTGRFTGEIVFAGYGVVGGGEGYSDYADVDVANKVVLLLRGAPAFAEVSDADKSFRAKASKANARDAAAILVVNALGDPADENAEKGDALYDFNQESPGFFGFGREDYGIPMMHITRAAADRLLQAAGMPDLAALQRRIEKKRKPVSALLEGVVVRGSVEVVPVETPVRNVVGMIPGTGKNADEIIILGAHYDHVGVQHKGEPNFDPEKDIFNGADDNASGTAMLMTMAKAYTEGPGPNRSILLIAFTAEELGLFGSGYYAGHPTVDLDKCVTMVNFDMVGRLKDDRLEIGGLRTGGFEDMAERLAEKYDLRIKDGGGGDGPSDQTAFYHKNIPIMFLFTGLHRQYHQPTDDVGLLNCEGAMRIARFAADCIDEIDAKADRPEFRTDTRPEELLVQNEGDRDGEEHPSLVPFRSRPRMRFGVEFGTEEGPGIQIESVAEDSPAGRAGLAKGDRIVSVGDETVDSPKDFFRALREARGAEKVMVSVRRKGKTLDIEVRLPKRGERGPREDSFKKAVEAVTALANDLQKEWKAGKSESAITCEETEKGVVMKVRFADRKDAVEFLERIAALFEKLPDAKEIKVKGSVALTVGVPGGVAVEAEIRLERPEQPDGPRGQASD